MCLVLGFGLDEKAMKSLAKNLANSDEDDNYHDYVVYGCGSPALSGANHWGKTGHWCNKSIHEIARYNGENL